MSHPFFFDVFLSHSARDKAVVRPLAERLRKDGVMVGACIPLDLEQLESGTFRFRDPLNKERRFLPLRLDDGHCFPQSKT